jgi:hypothetical protein
MINYWKMMRKQNQFILLVVFFFSGAIFRLWFVSLVPQPFVHDQLQYYNYAVGILEHGLFAHTYRGYGYPLFIAAVYGIFGQGNPWVWKIAQILMDTGTAVLVFSIAKTLFTKRVFAWIAFLLYLFNPYTATYTGVMLTEVAAIFNTTLIFFLFLKYLRKPSLTILVFLGLALGYLTQVRSSFYFFTLIFALYILTRSVICSYSKGPVARQLHGHPQGDPGHGSPRPRATHSISIMRVLPGISHLFKWVRMNLIIGVLFLSMYFLPYVYTIAGNLVYYRQFSLTTVHDFFVLNAYLSVFVDRWPLHADTDSPYPPQVGPAYGEYLFAPTNREERKSMAKKYLDATIHTVLKNPWYYVTRGFIKAFYIWDKREFFYFSEPENPDAVAVLRLSNITVLVSGIIGLLLWLITQAKRKQKIFLEFGFIMSGFLFYVHFAHILSVSEERFSLPGYPLIYLFVGYCLWRFVRLLREIPKKHVVID